MNQEVTRTIPDNWDHYSVMLQVHSNSYLH